MSKDLAGKGARRVLIYRLGSLGDMLIAMPAFHLVARAFPGSERRLLTNVPVNAKAPAAAAVLANTGLVDGYFRYAVGTRSLKELVRLWWTLVLWRPEVLVYLAGPRGVATAARDAKFFKLCGVKRMVGVPLMDAMQQNFYGAASGDLWEGNLEPEAARLCRNIAELGDGHLEDATSWDLHLSPEEHAAAAKAIGEEALQQEAIAVSVGTKVQAKDWGKANWRALLEAIATEFPGRALLLAGAPEESSASDFAAGGWRECGGGPVVNLCGKLTPRESAAAFARARIFVGHDSGPMHLSASVGTPVVAIFAARNIPRQWFPFGKMHRVLYHRVECWGCGLETCVEQRKKCLMSITVEEVMVEVRAALAGREATDLVQL
jgi:heptosyltransferase-3